MWKERDKHIWEFNFPCEFFPCRISLCLNLDIRINWIRLIILEMTEDEWALLLTGTQYQVRKTAFYILIFVVGQLMKSENVHFVIFCKLRLVAAFFFNPIITNYSLLFILIMIVIPYYFLWFYFVNKIIILSRFFQV